MDKDAKNVNLEIMNILTSNVMIKAWLPKISLILFITTLWENQKNKRKIQSILNLRIISNIFVKPVN